MDEVTAQRVLPLEVPPGQNYWSAWKPRRHVEDLPRMARTLAQTVISGAAGWSQDFRSTDRDGQVRWLHEEVAIERVGTARWRTTAICTDVTEAKRTEAALRESERRFAMFMANFPGPAVIKDADARLLYINTAAKNAAGGVADDIWLGKTAADLYPPDVAAVLMANDRKVLDAGEPLQTIESLPQPDGIHDYLFSKFSYAGVDGEPLLGGVGIDVTELRRAEAALRALAWRLARTEERERRRVAVTLHDDIGQSLALAQMRLARMREHAAQAYRGDQIVAEIDELTSNLDHVIHTTRTLTSELSPTILYELGLAPALRWAAERMLAPLGITLHWQDQCSKSAASGAVRVIAFQCVREIFLNVAKHAKARNVLVAIAELDGTLEITVRDDGVGFDPDDIAPRAGRAATGGFGLFNVREQLKYLGGRLEISSKRGGPSEVCVSLPLAPT